MARGFCLHLIETLTMAHEYKHALSQQLTYSLDIRLNHFVIIFTFILQIYKTI